MTDGSLSTTTETPVEAKAETERDGSQPESVDRVPLTPQTTKAPTPTTETTSITERAEPTDVTATVEDKTANWVLLAHPEEEPVVITAQDSQGVIDQRPLITGSDTAHSLDATIGSGHQEDNVLSSEEGNTPVQPLVTEEAMQITTQITDRPPTLPHLSAAETSAEFLPSTAQESALSRYCHALSAGASSLAESGWRGTCKYTPVAAGGLLLGTSYLFQGVEFMSSAIQLKAREKGRHWLGLKDSEISVNSSQN